MELRSIHISRRLVTCQESTYKVTKRKKLSLCREKNKIWQPKENWKLYPWSKKINCLPICSFHVNPRKLTYLNFSSVIIILILHRYQNMESYKRPANLILLHLEKSKTFGEYIKNVFLKEVPKDFEKQCVSCINVVFDC